jgi:hypothetical protein
MGLFRNYGAATNGRYPAPIVFNKVVAADKRGNDMFGFFTDFVGGVSASAAGTTLITEGVGQWIVSQITAGTITDAALEGGAVGFTPASTENQGIQAQTNVAFTPASGIQIAFGARVKFTDVTNADFAMGLAIADTDVAQSLPNSYALFNIVDGAADIYAKINKATVAEATDTTADAVNATNVNLECIIDELASVSFYVDGVLKVKTTTVASIPTVAMAYTIAIVNGATAAQAATVDWAYCFSWVK